MCPNSYHVTCIPPTARFNELSLLCPDHVADYKLPDVDPETSVQNKIEKKIDAKYAEVESPSRRRRKSNIKNPFFHGMAGKAKKEVDKGHNRCTSIGLSPKLSLSCPSMVFCA